MPYSDPKQATAIYLNIKRKKGEAAAHAFGRKHRKDFKRAYKAPNQRKGA